MFDSLGERLRSKTITRSDQDSITFRYNPFPITMVWGHLERKPYQSARQRYEREKRLSLELHQQGLRVPEILDFDDANLELKVKRLGNAVNFLDWVLQGKLPKTGQEQCLYDALTLLKEIHNRGHYHGDPYLKNFLLDMDDRDREITTYTTGLQYERDSANPQITDIQIMVASAISGLRHSGWLKAEDIFRLTRVTYGMVQPTKLSLRDRLFYTARFGMGERFFQFFERGY